MASEVTRAKKRYEMLPPPSSYWLWGEQGAPLLEQGPFPGIAGGQPYGEDLTVMPPYAYGPQPPSSTMAEYAQGTAQGAAQPGLIPHQPPGINQGSPSSSLYPHAQGPVLPGIHYPEVVDDLHTSGYTSMGPYQQDPYQGANPYAVPSAPGGGLEMHPSFGIEQPGSGRMAYSPQPEMQPPNQGQSMQPGQMGAGGYQFAPGGGPPLPPTLQRAPQQPFGMDTQGIPYQPDMRDPGLAMAGGPMHTLPFETPDAGFNQPAQPNPDPGMTPPGLPPGVMPTQQPDAGFQYGGISDSPDPYAPGPYSMGGFQQPGGSAVDTGQGAGQVAGDANAQAQGAPAVANAEQQYFQGPYQPMGPANLPQAPPGLEQGHIPPGFNNTMQGGPQGQQGIPPQGMDQPLPQDPNSPHSGGPISRLANWMRQQDPGNMALAGGAFVQSMYEQSMKPAAEFAKYQQALKLKRQQMDEQANYRKELQQYRLSEADTKRLEKKRYYIRDMQNQSSNAGFDTTSWRDQFPLRADDYTDDDINRWHDLHANEVRSEANTGKFFELMNQITDNDQLAGMDADKFLRTAGLTNSPKADDYRGMIEDSKEYAMERRIQDSQLKQAKLTLELLRTENEAKKDPDRERLLDLALTKVEKALSGEELVDKTRMKAHADMFDMKALQKEGTSARGNVLNEVLTYVELIKAPRGSKTRQDANAGSTLNEFELGASPLADDDEIDWGTGN